MSSGVVCAHCRCSLDREELEGPAWDLGELFRLDPRMLGKVEVEEETGCWIWTGAKQKSGRNHTATYGRVRRGGLLYLVHRWVFLVMVGRIPADHEVHHTCVQSLCVNPQHMEAIHEDEHRWLHREMDGYAAA